MCPTPPEGQKGWYGWHFIMSGNNNFTSLSVTFENAGTFSADPFPGNVFVAHPDNSHAYIWTPGPDSLLAGSATSDGDNAFFNLSHVCPGVGYEELTVSKTAVTSFTREHFWDIDKSVETENGYWLNGFPRILLFTDGSGDETATWTVDVSYEGYENSDFNVSGEITIENTGTLDAVITDVTDLLGSAAITVDFGVTFPYNLPVGETLTGTYSEDGYVEGKNEVTVTTERDEYFADADIVWGDPTTEINATVSIKDISDLFGEVDLGTVTAPTDGEITITINLTGDWEFEDVAENVMIQDYEFAPSGNPSPGLFDHKGGADPAESSFSISVPLNNFYGVHVNVGQWMPDPNFGP